MVFCYIKVNIIRAHTFVYAFLIEDIFSASRYSDISRCFSVAVSIMMNQYSVEHTERRVLLTSISSLPQSIAETILEAKINSCNLKC